MRFLGDDLREAMRFLGDDLREAMRFFGDDLREDMRFFGDDLREDMRFFGDDLRRPLPPERRRFGDEVLRVAFDLRGGMGVEVGGERGVSEFGRMRLAFL